MKKIIMFVFLVITIILFSGCSKYDDNPKYSAAGALSEENVINRISGKVMDIRLGYRRGR